MDGLTNGWKQGKRKGRKDRWTDKQLYQQTEGRKERRNGGWMNGGKDGQKDGWMNGGKDGQKEGRMDG